MVLHIHKARLQKLLMVDVANDFVFESDHGKTLFGRFARNEKYILSSLLFICCPEFTANFYLRLIRFLAVYEIKLQKTPAVLDSLRCSSFLTLFVVPHTKAVRCPCYNIQWFDGDAAQKIVDVVHQCESTLFKI